MYLCGMFPRKKRNRTGTISVVVVDKSRGGFKEVKSFGVAKTEEEADRLYAKASEWVQQISVEHTRKIFGGSIGLMFYNHHTLF